MARSPLRGMSRSLLSKRVPTLTLFAGSAVPMESLRIAGTSEKVTSLTSLSRGSPGPGFHFRPTSYGGQVVTYLAAYFAEAMKAKTATKAKKTTPGKLVDSYLLP